MFCKWCGKKLTNNGTPCPSCGRMQDALENGNGFWDLCSSKPVAPETIAGLPQTDNPSPNPAETKAADSSELPNTSRYKKVSYLSLALSGISILLLLILIVEVSIGLSTTHDQLEQYPLLHGEHSGIMGTVNDRFDALIQYFSENQVANNSPQGEAVQESEVVTPVDELDIDVLFETGDLVFLPDSEVQIEVHEITSDNASRLYIASGDCLEDRNTVVVWQKSIEAENGDECWETVAVGTEHLVVNDSEEMVYRFLRIAYIDYFSEYTCYFTSTAPVSAAIENKDEDNVQMPSDEEETPPSIDEEYRGTPDVTDPVGTEEPEDR